MFNDGNRVILQNLWDAAMDGDIGGVKEFLMNGADVEVRRGAFGDTPLTIAGLHGHLDIVDEFLRKGASVDATNSQGITALWGASLNGHLGIVKALLKVGADVDKPRNTGVTPLLIASHGGHSSIVDALLEARADPNRGEILYGVTPLHWASVTFSKHSETIVKRLLDSGAGIDSRTKLGVTPLMFAASYENMGTIKILVKRGADVTLTDNNGRSAVDWICGCFSDDPVECCSRPGTVRMIRRILKYLK